MKDNPKDNPLGKQNHYPDSYCPDLLFPIERKENRQNLAIDAKIFTGYDIWNAYEVSWLNKNGKPQVCLMRLIYSAHSDYIVESKSLKLYLFSFSMTKFNSEEEVMETIKKDLQIILGTSFIKIFFLPPDTTFRYTTFNENQVIDNLNIKTDIYELSPELLKSYEGSKSSNVLISHLLKTNCPITKQPDWATLYIYYYAQTHIDKKSLLQYIISYRNCLDYHESCCEKIFNDLFLLLKPEQLIVKCFFSRRGGIDINPCRFYGIKEDYQFQFHVWRQ